MSYSRWVIPGLTAGLLVGATLLSRHCREPAHRRRPGAAAMTPRHGGSAS